MTITLTLNPEEVAGIIHARAGNLCHAVTYPEGNTVEESVPELISSLREAVDALDAARIEKTESHPIPPEGEVPATEVEVPTPEAEGDKSPYKTSTKIYDLGNTLGHLASAKAAGLEIPEDAATAVGALKKLVEAVKTLYGLNDDEAEEPADEDVTSLPKTESEVEAETERLVRNAQEYQQTARRVLKEVR